MKNKFNVRIKKAHYIFIILALIFLILLILFQKSFAISIDDEEVIPNTLLTYYLNVSYDGIDRNGVKSSDSKISSQKSGYLYIEDKIPEGLTFEHFVTTEDGTIGAVERGTTNTCIGKVLDDTNENSVDEGVWNGNEYTYHGLHYNNETRMVTFTVEKLTAGCELTVGIVTRTPKEIDDPDTSVVEKRRDFYNFASGREEGFNVNSNTVHVFMGSEDEKMYNVTYEYTDVDSDDFPDNPPALPTVSSYASGSNVLVAPDVQLEGYTFSGWSTDNVTVVNDSFKMPEHDVVLKGSFTKINTNTVNYTISGTVPPGYEPPLDKEYYPGQTVTLDSMKQGDIFNGYKFLGWKIDYNDIEVDEDNNFIMPKHNVNIVGSFEEVKYKVKYQFFDTVLPPNADDYLPATKSFKPGTKVTLEDVLAEPSGYKFLGWYKEDEFEMPEEDIIIYGEWKRQTGTFSPTITKELISNKNYYRTGDIVKFKVTVTNTATFDISDVIVVEKNEKAQFISGNNYTLLSDHVVNIGLIPAGGKVEVYSTYKVTDKDSNFVENTVEINGALADNYYELAEKEYVAQSRFNIQSKLTICKEVSGAYVPNTFQFIITGTTSKYETWVTMEKDQCKSIYIDPSTYKIKEVIPQEYEISMVNGAITSDNSSLNIEQGKNYKITYTNKFKKKGFLHSFGRVVNRIIQGDG